MRDAIARRENANAPVKTSARHPLVVLANRLRRLAPSHTDPHRYFEEKSQIEYELRRLARRDETLSRTP